MSWEYRVIRVYYPDRLEEPYMYEVYEVYYDDEGRPSSWSKDPINAHGQTWFELKADLAAQQRALNLPVLEIQGGALVPVESPQEKFDRLVAAWAADTAVLSDSQKILESNYYKRLRELGDDLLPCVLRDLRDKGPRHWFQLLCELTGEDPVSEAIASGQDIAGDMEAMARVWVHWGAVNGYLR